MSRRIEHHHSATQLFRESSHPSHKWSLEILPQARITSFLAVSLPTSTVLVLEFGFTDDRSPLLRYLPGSFAKFLSHITTVNLAKDKFLLLEGPAPLVTRYRTSTTPNQWWNFPPPVHPLDAQWLTISNSETDYMLSESFIPHSNQTSQPTLYSCLRSQQSPFGPRRTSEIGSGSRASPTPHFCCIRRGVRASGGTKLSLITIAGLDELILAKEVSRPGQHASRVDHEVDDAYLFLWC